MLIFLFRNKYVTQSAWSFIATGRSKGDKYSNCSYTTPLPGTVVVNFLEKGTPSSVTDESAKVSEVSQEPPMPKIAHIRLPIKAAQVRCAEAVKKKREFNQAFKCTTILYDRERQKPDGMSTQTVINLIKNSTGVE